MPTSTSKPKRRGGRASALSGLMGRAVSALSGGAAETAPAPEAPGVAAPQAEHAPEPAHQPEPRPARDAGFDHLHLRGGVGFDALGHALAGLAAEVSGVFAAPAHGMTLPVHHSVFARHAIDPVPPAVREVFAEFGYRPGDFTAAPPAAGRVALVLDLSADAGYALYRHSASGYEIPVPMAKFARNRADITTLKPGPHVDPQVQALLRRAFTFLGPISEAAFKANIRAMLRGLAAGSACVAVLPTGDAERPVKLAAWLADLAEEGWAVTVLEQGADAGAIAAALGARPAVPPA